MFHIFLALIFLIKLCFESVLYILNSQLKNFHIAQSVNYPMLRFLKYKAAHLQLYYFDTNRSCLSIFMTTTLNPPLAHLVIVKANT